MSEGWIAALLLMWIIGTMAWVVYRNREDFK